MVIDGGPCLHGVESTIVLLGPRPQLLRPGSITRETLIERLGDSLASAPQHPSEQQAPYEREPAGTSHDKVSGETWLAPGMMREHYAPSTPLVLLAHDRTPDSPMPLARQGRAGGAGRIAFRTLLPEETAGYRIVETLSQRGDLTEIARQLFAALRRLDNAGLSVIHCDTCEAVGLGLAIMDRLVRAAARTSDNTAKAHNGDSTESD
jgi:L-threonylcarbamoyladenylate synthase